MVKRFFSFVFIDGEFLLSYLTRKIKTRQEYSRLFSNFSYLSFLQLANYVLPIISLPYLVRVLGVEKFGLVSFAYAAAVYFIILTDYGFNLSATRQVAVNRGDILKISRILAEVTAAKIFLALIGFLGLSVLVFSFDKFRADWFLYYLAFSSVLGNLLFPVWFFQGMENMRHIAWLNASAKSLYVIGVFMLIKSPADYWKVPLINSLSAVFVGFFSVYLIFLYFKVKLFKPNFQEILAQLKDGADVFLSGITSSVYTLSSAFILGLFVNNTAVGYFSAADKIAQAVKSLMGPLAQSVYPFISNKMSASIEDGLKFFKKLSKLVVVFSVFVSAVLFIFSEFIVSFFLGSEFKESLPLLRIMAFMPFAAAMTNLYGVQGLISMGFAKDFRNVLVRGSFLSVVFSLIFIPHYGAVASSVIVIVTEIFIGFNLRFVFNKKSVDLKKRPDTI